MHEDWNGNNISSYVCNGASNHSNKERIERDFYATDPEAVRKLLEVESFNNSIWECACGNGHVSKELINKGYKVISTDIIKREYQEQKSEIDFLSVNKNPEALDIVTNPPYKYAKQFVEKGLSLINEGCKIAFFLKLTFLESESRKDLFKKFPPKNIYVFSKRVNCARNGIEEEFKQSSAVCYAWFVWEKGYSGKPAINWI